MHGLITPDLTGRIVELIPEEWLVKAEPDIDPAEQRRVYTEFLTRRLENSGIFTAHAVKARSELKP